MAAAAHLQGLKEEATCSICLEYFTEPVSVECGHAFCLSCITQCWEGLEANFPCPQCRPTKQFHLSNLCKKHEEKLNLFCEDDQRPICVLCGMSRDHKSHKVLLIQEAAQEYKDKLYSHMKHLQKELKDLQEWGEEESRKASELQGNIMKQRENILSTFEHLKQFLEKEKQQLLSRLEKEQEEKMKKIQEKLTRLEEQQSTHRDLITELESKCQQQDVDLLKVRGDQKSIELEHQSTARDLITELERKCQQQDMDLLKVRRDQKPIELEQQSTHRGMIPEIEQRCQQQDRELLKVRQDQKPIDLEQQSTHRGLITELERKCQQQGVDLLKDVKRVLGRCSEVKALKPQEDAPGMETTLLSTTRNAHLQEKLTELKETFPAEMDWRYVKSCEPLAVAVIDRLLAPCDWLVSEPGFSLAGEVTLDSGTAHPRLIVSADGRSVRCGPRVQDLPDTPQRFTGYYIVLGREGLSSGEHYWEVEVGGSTCWTLGVCDESVSRKGGLTLSPEGGFWTVQLRDGEYWALTSPRTPLTPRAPPRVLGLFLDYEAGRVSVYDAQDRALLFTFPGAPFPRTLRPYFRTRSPEGGGADPPGGRRGLRAAEPGSREQDVRYE
ncbi:E3 ubiquitin-protein ligase TRIM39-like [Ambystoma mexicanum]|uniref:E3 ubiquitin-protein ligase TRIM39-like n=1 Tax=Ambystoma mexicanum TaxID=8296 RepID=UPI0037E7D56C